LLTPAIRRTVDLACAARGLTANDAAMDLAPQEREDNCRARCRNTFSSACRVSLAARLVRRRSRAALLWQFSLVCLYGDWCGSPVSRKLFAGPAPGRSVPVEADLGAGRDFRGAVRIGAPH